MHRARAPDHNPQPAERGAESSAPRLTPLTLVAGAVAGQDLQSVAATVAEALGGPVAIAIPALGPPVVAPPALVTALTAAAIGGHAALVVQGEDPLPPPPVADAVPVRIGELVVGVVAAIRAAGDTEAPPERRAWLEAAAAAASVTALIRETHEGAGGASDAVLLAELAAGPPADLPAFLVRARRLGLDLTAGAVAISARRNGRVAGGVLGGELEAEARRLVRGARPAAPALMAELRPGALLALVPTSAGDAANPPGELADVLRHGGLAVVMSAPRRDAALLHHAVREAELLAELGVAGEAEPVGPGATYRLLIAVLLHARPELEQLRDSTVTPLAAYDARHDTDLIETLQGFLAHHGSTTETAETMQLHRHTVGYRLSRVHEVSGLSPYESDGRERLSLGLKAHQILQAERRLEEAAPSSQ